MLHMKDPVKVYSENFQMFMRAMPAGKEINVRTIGRTREAKIVIGPYLANSLSPRSKS